MSSLSLCFAFKQRNFVLLSDQNVRCPAKPHFIPECNQSGVPFPLCGRVSSVTMLHHPFHPNSQKGCARTSFYCLTSFHVKYVCVLCYSLQFCIQRFCRLCLQHGRHPDGLQRTVCAQGRAQLPVGGFPGPDPLPTTGNCESHTLMSCLGTVTLFITSLNTSLCFTQFS